MRVTVVISFKEWSGSGSGSFWVTPATTSDCNTASCTRVNSGSSNGGTVGAETCASDLVLRTASVIRRKATVAKSLSEWMIV
jgi:hypothetical protein